MAKRVESLSNENGDNASSAPNANTNGPGSGSPESGANGAKDAANGSVPPVDGNTDGSLNSPDRIGGPEIPKKRGRPALSAAEKEARAAARTGTVPKASGVQKNAGSLGLDRKLLATQMQGLHGMAAILTGNQVLQINEQEATALANAITDLAVHYQLDFAGPVALWTNLVATVGMIYVPRFLMMQQMKAIEAANRKAAAQGPGHMPTPQQGPIDYSGTQPN
jgi:hypothetical protein